MMYFRRKSLTALVAALVSLASMALAETPAEALARAAKSVATVEYFMDKEFFTATAFCVDPAGLYVTLLPHRLHENNAQHGVRLLVNPGTPQQKILSVKLWPADRHFPFRVLSVTPPAGLAALEPFPQEKVETGAAVTVLAAERPTDKRGAGRIKPLSLTVVHSPTAGPSLQHKDTEALPASATGAPIFNEAGQLVGVVTAPPRFSGIGSVTHFLSLRHIEFDPGPISYARRTEKREFTVRVHPFYFPKDKLVVELGIGDLRHGLRTVATMAGPTGYKASVAPMEVEEKEITHAVDYRVTVKLDEKVIAALPGTLDLEGNPATRPSKLALEPFSIQPPELEAEVVNIPMFASADGFFTGGGGRFVFALLSQQRRLAVMDVSLGRIVKYLTLPAGPVVCAAGATRLVVIAPEQNLMQRWNLRSFQREQTAPIPRGLNVHSAVMGSASDGPVVMLASTRAQRPQYGLLFVDVGRLTELPVEMPRGGDWKIGTSHYAMRISDDGRVLCAWEPKYEAKTTVHILRLGDRMASAATVEEQWLVPSADGSVFFGPDKVYASDLSVLSNVVSGRFVPMENSVCYLHVDGPNIRLMLTADRKALVPAPLDPWGKLLHVSAANLLINCSGSSFRLKRFDLGAALEKGGGDYFFIDSLPVRAARKGGTYSYQMNVRSKAGGVRYTLETGPKGMTLSENGLLQWEVPPDTLLTYANVAIVVSDAGNKSTRQAFTLTVK
jgi:hypothetical protein